MPPRRPQALAVHFEGEGEEEEGEVAVPGQGQEEEPVSVPTQETVQVRERKWGEGGKKGKKRRGEVLGAGVTAGRERSVVQGCSLNLLAAVELSPVCVPTSGRQGGTDPAPPPRRG